MNVALVKCESYDSDIIQNCIHDIMQKIGDIDIKQGDNIVLKVNLVGAHKPSEAVTTHPEIVSAVAKYVIAKGGNAIIADSPGSLYTHAKLQSIYRVTQMTEAARSSGAKLNDDFSSATIDYPNGLALKKFDILGVLDKCDGIINLCKYKTHTFTGFSACIKNMFGAIPGLKKVEMHGTHTELSKFCDLLLDIQEYFAPKILAHICDAVVGMEGDGPTGGDPKHIGCIIASKCCYSADVVALKITKNDYKSMPMIYRAIERALFAIDEINIVGESIDSCMVSEYNNVAPNTNRILNKMPRFIFNMFASKPVIKPSLCRGCNKCFEHCPPKAITMKDSVASIDLNKCIRCYCCQELCPFHVVKVKRPIVSRIINKKSKIPKK